MTGSAIVATAWSEWSTTQPGQSLGEYLKSKLLPTGGSSSHDKGSSRRRPKLIIFGEQHHQPKVLAAQLQLIQTLATEPFNLKVTVIMEHFNVLQQTLLDDFAKTGYEQALQEEYAKSSEGFRITNAGYLPVLRLVRELENVNSAVIAGFPPREWARVVMRQGKEGLEQDEQISHSNVLEGFDRWEGLKVSPEHAAYISSSISGAKPEIQAEVQQGGLKAAQAFKDTVMAWIIDRHVEAADNTGEEIIVAICGSGHCEFDFGITERIRACKREDILLLVCRPDDGSYWSSSESNRNSNGRPLADGIIVYEGVDV